MTFSLTKDSTTLTLPSDLLWPNEFEWAGVKQDVKFSVTGALIVQSAAKSAGREITLQGGSDFAWANRTLVEALYAWTLLPGQVFGLVLRTGSPVNVIFDHAAGAMEATPILDFSDPDATDYYQIALRFLKV